MTIQAEVIEGPHRWAAYKSEWDQLVQTVGAEPSASFEWTSALLDSHLKPEDDLFLLVLKQAGEVTALVPLIIRKRLWLGQPLRLLLPLSELYTTHSDLLLRDYSEPVLRMVIEQLYRLPRPWDVFSMKRLLDDHPLGRLWPVVLKTCGRRSEWVPADPSFFLSLNGTYEDYLRARSSSFRNAVRRIDRKLLGRGRVEIRDHLTFRDIDDAYSALMAVERRSWKHAQGTAISALSRQTVFYHRLCRETARTNSLHLRFLYVNDCPVAYNLGILKHGSYFYLKTSYDDAERQWSPSTYLRAELIKELIRDGVTRFDFPAEPYEWERQWTHEVRWHHSLALFAFTMKGFMYGLYRNAKRLGRGDDLETVRYTDAGRQGSRLTSCIR